MAKFASTWLLILIAVAVSTLGFIGAGQEDAPGVALLGGIAGFVLVVCALRNLGVIKPGLALPIIALGFGLTAVLLSIRLLADGEFGSRPWIAAIGVVVGAALTGVGVWRYRAVSPAPTRPSESEHLR
ncbi:MAG: hypothetical protein LBH13_05620 [Cellulomonadaceae bacterium]|nr:hypothetical protein [Cellulomonadaceae bacterium]